MVEGRGLGRGGEWMGGGLVSSALGIGATA